MSRSSFIAHQIIALTLCSTSITSQKSLFSRFASHIPLLATMGACLSIVINACNQIFGSAISSTQPVPDSEEIASSTVVLHSNPTTMASTSSSTGNPSQPLGGCGKYDVFINHHGKDVKNSLASSIYHRLESIRVRAFLDREVLERGEKISEAIKEAISSASVQIAIFSPNYAKSRWCLDELTQMLHTGKKFIPIFYRVEPSHVRHILGTYLQAFSKHEEDRRYTPQQLDEWKTALFEASNFYGHEVKVHQNDEGLVVEKIITDVTTEMKKMSSLPVATHPVGLDEATEKFQEFVETRSQCSQSTKNIKIVGIVGLGGCGKTTLAKEYFNKQRSSYPRSSFLFDVRDAAANNRLHDLQSKLLEDLVSTKEAIHHKTEGKRTLEHRVRSVKALIVLDDVDRREQIEDLLPLKGNLQDSLIIVTTRDSSVIESSASLSLSVSVSVYIKRTLDRVHAKQLFCWHAFLQDSPVKGFEDLVERFLKACQGLPLSLKVLGSQLYGKDDNYWESQLHKISKTLHDNIKQTLKVSYEALDEEQQQMFLDVACFFIGEQKDMAISIWDGSQLDDFLWSGRHGFQILESKCLVEVGHDNRLRMHDHLRDLGREIAIKEKPSRFWSHSQFIYSRRPLEERLPMRGIMAATGSDGKCNLYYEPPLEECMQLLTEQPTSRSRRHTPSALGLQLLVVRGDYFKEQFAKLSEELVWLRWYDFPRERLPWWLSTAKLRVLELYQANSLAELWGPNDSPPAQLRELIIVMSNFRHVPRIPKTIRFLKYLKKIVLKIIPEWRAITSLPDMSLPEEFCLLESLEHLELSQCPLLSTLPVRFGNLRKLKYIDLSNCGRLKALPVSFKQLSELQHLDLHGCNNLQLEKDNLENITKLEKLTLGGCFKLQQLPSEITRQMCLRKLCLLPTALRELPADIDRLAKLEVLEIGSQCLTSLPTSLGNLPSLIRLGIYECSELKCLPSLPNLPCLIELVIDSCQKLTHLPPVGCLTCLETLYLSSSGVEYLPEGFGQLVSLKNLVIENCPIRELPLANPEERSSKKPTLLNHADSSMFKFPRLKVIYLVNTKVSAISISKDCCPSLEDLRLFGEDDLMKIETLPPTIKSVKISYCKKLENIRGVVAGLAKLHDLEIGDCPGLAELPSFAGVAELQKLEISDCPIREFPLANPEERSSKKPRLINHVDSSMIKPEMFPRLKSIHLKGTKVSTISISEDCCPILERLDLSKNHDLREIKTLPTILNRVQISCCEKLENIGGVAVVAGLQRLEILECPELDELPSFARCTCLEVLKIDVSRRVTKIEGLEELRSFARLQIRAERRSAIERCIPANIVKRGCVLEIVGRPVEDVESVVGSLSFPTFTVVDTLHECDLGLQMKSSLSNGNCVIVCFVISPHEGPPIRYESGSESHPTSSARFDGFLPLLEEGRQVYIGVWPQGFHINDFVEGTERVFFPLYNCGVVEKGMAERVFFPLHNCGVVEKGMAVILKNGEEEKTLETLHKFLELLQR